MVLQAQVGGMSWARTQDEQQSNDLLLSGQELRSVQILMEHPTHAQELSGAQVFSGQASMRASTLPACINE